MKYEMKTEHKSAFNVIGYSKEIKSENGYKECPEFWNKEYWERYAHLWQTMKPENAEEQAVLDNQIGCFGVCIMAEDGSKFEYMIAGEYKGGEIPLSMKLYEFPESDWIMFSAKGVMPEALQKLNDYIWCEWCKEHEGEYDLGVDANIEWYSCGNPKSEDYECGIWLPVIKNN